MMDLQDVLLQRELLVLQVVATLLVGLLLYRGFLHPLADFPGPFLARYTGLWRTARYFNGKWHDDVVQLHEKYGKVVRIAPNELSIVDETAIKQLYGPGSTAKKTTYYHSMDAPLGVEGLFQTVNTTVHAMLKRRVSSAYSMSALLKYEPYIQPLLDLLFQKLRKYANRAGPEGAKLNMSEWTNAFTFDVVGELAYGEPIGDLETETDVMGIRRSIFETMFVQANFANLPFQSKLIVNPVLMGLFHVLRIPNAGANFLAHTQKMVRDRQEHGLGEKREDMLSYFTKMKDADGNPASYNEIIMEVSIVV